MGVFERWNKWKDWKEWDFRENFRFLIFDLRLGRTKKGGTNFGALIIEQKETRRQRRKTEETFERDSGRVRLPSNLIQSGREDGSREWGDIWVGRSR